MPNHEQSGVGYESYAPELVARYNETLALVADSYEQGVDNIVGTYQDNIGSLEAEPTVDHINNLVQQPNTAITRLTGNTVRDLNVAIELVAKKGFKTLSPSDQDRLVDALVTARQTDLSGSGYQVTDILATASGRQAQGIMAAALDYEIWRQAQNKARQVDLGINAYQVTNILNRASSDQAHWAMKAALDYEIWRQAQGMAKKARYDYPLSDILYAASTRKSQVAMKAALDYEIWRQAQGMAMAKRADLDVTVTSNQIIDTLGHISSKQLKKVIVATCLKTFNDYSRKAYKQRSSAQSFTSDSFNRTPRSNSSVYNYTVPRNQEYPYKQQPQQEELDVIIHRAVTAAPNEGWLTRANKDDIKMAIDSIKNIRKQAKAKGEIITDREAYIMYRRNLETNSLDKATHQRLTTSVQIILALMGGSPSGKLPF